LRGAAAAALCKVPLAHATATPKVGRFRFSHTNFTFSRPRTYKGQRHKRHESSSSHGVVVFVQTPLSQHNANACGLVEKTKVTIGMNDPSIDV
jgi:hypothetical protein